MSEPVAGPSNLAFHHDEEEVSVVQLLNDLSANDEQRDWVGSYLKKVDEPFIHEYISSTSGSTHGYNLKVVETFKINRPADAVDFWEGMHNRRFLWHGTSKKNLYSIIRDGFDLKFAKPGTMFGKGIYFSDCCTKSIGYCRNELMLPFMHPGHRSNNSHNHSYLLLCEVALGQIKKCKNAVYNAEQTLNDEDSVLGEGMWSTTAGTFDEEGVMICPGKLEQKGNTSGLMYNEFIVYNTNQIRLKYLVKVSNTYNQTPFNAVIPPPIIYNNLNYNNVLPNPVQRTRGTAKKNSRPVQPTASNLPGPSTSTIPRSRPRRKQTANGPTLSAVNIPPLNLPTISGQPLPPLNQNPVPMYPRMNSAIPAPTTYATNLPFYLPRNNPPLNVNPPQNLPNMLPNPTSLNKRFKNLAGQSISNPNFVRYPPLNTPQNLPNMLPTPTPTSLNQLVTNLAQQNLPNMFPTPVFANPPLNVNPPQNFPNMLSTPASLNQQLTNLAQQINNNIAPVNNQAQNPPQNLPNMPPIPASLNQQVTNLAQQINNNILPVNNQAPNQPKEEFPSVYCPLYSNFAPPNIDPLTLISQRSQTDDDDEEEIQQLCIYCENYHA